MKAKRVCTVMIIAGLLSALFLTAGCDESVGSSAYKTGKGAREGGKCLWDGLSGKDNSNCK